MRALPLLESTRVLLSVVVLFDVRKAVPCAQGGMFLRSISELPYLTHIYTYEYISIFYTIHEQKW